MGRQTAISFTCSQCGAPLPLSTPGVVKCPRCNTDNFVSLPQAPQQPAPPAVHVYAPQMVPHVPPAIVVHSPGRGGGAVVGLLAASLAIAGVGAGAYFFIQRGQQAESIVSWSGSPQRICLADANGDGTEEVIGNGTIGAGQSLIAIDGATGKIVWKQPVGTEESTRSLICGGGGILSVDLQGDTVTSIDPATGKSAWSTQLSDKLEKFAFGDKCVVLGTIDKKTATLDVASGKGRTCEARTAAIGIYETQEDVAIGDTRIELTTSSGPGTPRLVVRATSKDKELWTSAFPELQRDKARVLATPEGVVVAAQGRASEELTVALLDVKTGAVRHQAVVKIKDATFLKLAHNDKTLFVESFGMLHTYALKTLAAGWWVGKFWVDK
ncbi:MAG: PQQ-binding-like beta-propeller repeat protein [Polyangiaceae bacterium]